MVNLTTLPIEISQKQSDNSSSFQITYEYAWANNTNGENNQESYPCADCNASSSYNISLFNLTLSCEPGGENQWKSLIYNAQSAEPQWSKVNAKVAEKSEYAVINAKNAALTYRTLNMETSKWSIWKQFCLFQFIIAQKRSQRFLAFFTNLTLSLIFLFSLRTIATITR